jgi:hypothetical protein
MAWVTACRDEARAGWCWSCERTGFEITITMRHGIFPSDRTGQGAEREKEAKKRKEGNEEVARRRDYGEAMSLDPRSSLRTLRWWA